MAAGHQHAARARAVDVWRGSRHLCREPESRVLARRRRAAEHEASAGEALPRDRAQRDVPRRGRAVAQREYRSPSGRRRLGPGPGKRDGHLERQRAAVSRARRRFPLGAHDRRRRRPGQDHRRVDAVGQDVQAPARGLCQSLRRAEARLGRRRPHPRNLQVHERRQEAGADDRHAKRRRRRWHALQPADVHGVDPRRELLRGRRV